MSKYLFIDMDGTIADINFDTHPKDEYEEGFFENKKPSYTIINAIKEVFKDRNLKILSASPSSLTDEEKRKWLTKYFPEIYYQNIHFINWPRDNKIDCLLRICSWENINIEEVILIDDNLDILRESNTRGIKAIHPIRVLIMKEELECSTK